MGVTTQHSLDDSADTTSRPDPFSEIRMVSLSATRGANYWSTRPVTRLDVVCGAFENIASSDVGEFVERLVTAIPSLEEHRCSIGERGGFVTRLQRGTYAPHIIEHVALELQALVGHRVGYGRTRGGDELGQYTIITEHWHEATGMRAAALALDVVHQAFAGTLESVDHAVAELQGIAAMPDVPPITPRVACGITGGSWRSELRKAIAARMGETDDVIVDVSPSFLLQAGLPYAESRVAIVTDTELTDVPQRYRHPERAERLVSVIASGVERGGLLIAPATEWELQDDARREGCAVAVFSGTDDITRKDKKVARAAAWISDGAIVVEQRGRQVTHEPLDIACPPAMQAASILAAMALQQE
jgi:cyanophycin synthetase